MLALLFYQSGAMKTTVQRTPLPRICQDPRVPMSSGSALALSGSWRVNQPFLHTACLGTTPADTGMMLLSEPHQGGSMVQRHSSALKSSQPGWSMGSNIEACCEDIHSIQTYWNIFAPCSQKYTLPVSNLFQLLTTCPIVKNKKIQYINIPIIKLWHNFRSALFHIMAT